MIDDLAGRLTTKAAALDEMATKESRFEATRLHGKAEGVRLALSFIDEIQRTPLTVDDWHAKVTELVDAALATRNADLVLGCLNALDVERRRLDRALMRGV